MPHDDSDHHHGNGPLDHRHRVDEDAPLTDAQILEIAVRELLIEKGVTTAAEIAAQIAKMDARSPALGAEVVAKAWTDPAFKEWLLRDGSAACRSLGVTVDAMKLVVVENTPEIHNLVVCTLCSCYPRNLLGLPPDWYKARAYRTRAVIEPRRVLEEFGCRIAPERSVRVHDSTADMRYLVLPMRPDGAEGFSLAELAALVTRDAMIGVAEATAPSAR